MYIIYKSIKYINYSINLKNNYLLWKRIKIVYNSINDVFLYISKYDVKFEIFKYIIFQQKKIFKYIPFIYNIKQYDT